VSLKYNIICSNQDKASINIKNALVDLYHFKEQNLYFEESLVYSKANISIYSILSESVFREGLDKELPADVYLFASKHQSKKGVPTLTVHSIGNWGLAELGGKDNTLVLSSAWLQRDLFINLHKFSKDSIFEIVNEATHHGPFLDKPTIYIEIGSTEKEWENLEMAKVVAKTIMTTLAEERNKTKVAIGIGGLHTCNNFNKIILNKNIAISHFCPKYALQYLNRKLIEEAIQKTSEKVELAILDWKGLSTHKDNIVKNLKSIGLDFEKTSTI